MYLENGKIGRIGPTWDLSIRPLTIDHIGAGAKFELVERTGDTFIIDQGIFGDPYVIGADQQLALQVIKGPGVEFAGGEWVVSYVFWNLEPSTFPEMRRITFPGRNRMQAILYASDLPETPGVLLKNKRVGMCAATFHQLDHMTRSYFGGYFTSLSFAEIEVPIAPYDYGASSAKNKTVISDHYIKNSSKIRREVLAGVIDALDIFTDDKVGEIGMWIYLPYTEFALSLQRLAKSLGHLCVYATLTCYMGLSSCISPSKYDITNRSKDHRAYPISISYAGVQTHHILEIKGAATHPRCIAHDQTVMIL